MLSFRKKKETFQIENQKIRRHISSSFLYYITTCSKLKNKRKQKTSRYERIIFFSFDLYLEKLMAATTTPRKYQNQIKEEATGRIRIKRNKIFCSPYTHSTTNTHLFFET